MTGCFVRDKSKTQERDTPRGIRAMAGTLSGAGLGFVVAGPAGLAFGGLAGLLIGFSSDMMARSEE